MILTNPVERTRFIKFGIVGIIGAIVDFSIFNLFISILKFEPLFASTISFIAAVISNFLLNRFWTFPNSRKKSYQKQFFQFLIVSLIGLGIRSLLFNPILKIMNPFAVQFVPYDFIIKPERIAHNLTLAILIVLVMFWNFYVNRYWTFNDVKSVTNQGL